MRWQQLFADLQAQFEQEEASAERAEDASRARAEIGAVALSDRLRGAVGAPLVLVVAGSAVRAVGGLVRRTAAPQEPGPVRAALDLRRALRGLARDRAAVQVVLDDGGVLAGTVDRVGADYVELAEHAVDAPRRAEAVQGVRAVVISAIAVVRTVAPGI